MKFRPLTYFSICGLAVVASLSLLVSCSKSSNSTPTVPAAGVSATSTAISSHLEYGGEFFAVMDLKGDIEHMGNMLADFVGYVIQQSGGMMGTPTSKLDYRALVKKLGFYNVDGLGMSSWKDSDGLHHNLSFLYTPNGRPGLLKIFGDKAGPFVTPELAPADTDLVLEGTIDLKSLEELVVSYVQDIGGAAAAQEITDELKQSVPGTTLTGQNLVDRLNTRFIVIARADTKQILQAGPGAKIPMTDFVIALDGFADVLDQLEPLLKGNPMITFAEKSGMKTATVELPIPAPFSIYKPMLISDPKSKRLYFISRESFADETVFGKGARLSTSEDYKAATAGMATEGNWLGYVSKKGATAFVQYYDRQIMADMPPALRDGLIDFGGMDKIPHGLATVQVNLPDGILTQSTSTHSAKDVVLIVPAVLVAVVGIGASETLPMYSAMGGGMAPARNSGGSSRDSAIRNNLRLISTAAIQYMLDKGVTEVRYMDLTAGPTPYLRDITSIAGESYGNLVIRQTTTRISVTTADGQVISFDM